EDAREPDGERGELPRQHALRPADAVRAGIEGSEPREEPVAARPVVARDRPAHLDAGESVRAETAFRDEQEREHAPCPQRLDTERLTEEDDPRRGELVERDAAAVLVLGGAAVADVAAAERSVHRVEGEIEARDRSALRGRFQLREGRTKYQWIRDVARQCGANQRTR